MAYLCEKCKELAKCQCGGPVMGYRICSVCRSTDRGWYCSCNAKSVRIKNGYTLKEVLIKWERPVKLCDACKTKKSYTLNGEKLLHRCDRCKGVGIVSVCSREALVK